MATKTLPCSPEAEQAVIGSMIQSREAINTVSQILTVDDFYEPRNAILFGLIVSIISANTDPFAEVDLVILGEKLKLSGQLREVGGIDYIIQVAESTPNLSSASSYANIVRARSDERRLAVATNDIARLVYDGSLSPEEKATKASEILKRSIPRKSETSTIITMASLAQGYRDEIDEVRRNGLPKKGLMLGFSELDSFTGGLLPGQSVIVAARPGMGKTALAVSCAVNVARKSRTPCLIFSKEMPSAELFRRTISSICGLPANITRTQVPNGATYDMLQEAIDQVISLPVFFEETNDQNIEQIRDIARKFDQEISGLGLIVIDYIQLVRGTNSRDNRVAEMGEVSRGIKAMANELKLPVISLSQLSRATESRDKTNRRPQLSDLRESGAIEQDADKVIGIYRDEYYNPPEIGPAQNPNHIEPTELIFLKNRNGPQGTVTLGFQAAFTRFREYAPIAMPFGAVAQKPISASLEDAREQAAFPEYDADYDDPFIGSALSTSP